MRKLFTIAILATAIQAVTLDSELEAEKRGRGKMWFRKALADGDIGEEWEGRLKQWESENPDLWREKR